MLYGPDFERYRDQLDNIDEIVNLGLKPFDTPSEDDRTPAEPYPFWTGLPLVNSGDCSSNGFPHVGFVPKTYKQAAVNWNTG